MNLNKKFDAQIKEIVVLHDITKHYIILGEETDGNFMSYLQPLKEFRDAYDHFLRIMKNVFYGEEGPDDSYIEKQFSKALGHEYRAFFDVADWLSIVCRQQAHKAIEGREKSISQIKKEFPEYHKHVDVINNADKRIAEIRSNKDVGVEISTLVNEYQEVIAEIYEAMLYIRKAAFIAKDE